MAASRQTESFGWHLQLGRVNYERTLDWQRSLVKMRREGFARDTIITVEHPPVVTVGRDGHPGNYKDLKEQPFFIERGGDVTFHGPGQLVVYYIFNLARRGRDLHKFMDDVQQGMIQTLAKYGVTGRVGDEYTGVWVDDKKIASIGIAVKHWVTFHGSAINLNTNLEEFTKINPCGLNPGTMTSVEKLTGRKVMLDEFARALLDRYAVIFETTFSPIDLDSLAEDIESQSGGHQV